MKTHHKKPMSDSVKDSPLLRKMLRQKPIAISCVSALCSSQDDPMACCEPLDLRIKNVEYSCSQTNNSCDPVNAWTASPSETSLRGFLRAQQGEKEGLRSTPRTDSAIHPTPQVSISKPWLGDTTAHPLPRVSERDFAQGLHPTQKKSATKLVKFFHGRTDPPIFSRVLDLESLSPHSMVTELPLNDSASSQLNTQEKVVTSFQGSQGEATGLQNSEKTKVPHSRKVVRSLFWTPCRLEDACSTTDHAKTSGTHPYASFKPNRSCPITHWDTNHRDHRLLPGGMPLENGLNVVLQEEVRPQENEQLASSCVVQTLPLKKRKWLWSSSLKEDLSATVENNMVMRSTTCLSNAFFKSNVFAIDAVSSDEDSLASNPLEIDLDRPDTP